MPQVVYSGYNSYQNLKDILTKLSSKKVFLVTGKRSYKLSRAESMLAETFKNIDYDHFNDFNPNPQVEELQRSLNAFNNTSCDCVVGIGGGSTLDMAKAVSLLGHQKGSPEAYIKGEIKVKNKGIPSILIPTTAGSGSESSCYSVFNIGKQKYSLTDNKLIPNFAILDPTFTETLPNYVAAFTGMDALCQAIEAFWSVHSTEESRKLSKKALALALTNIEKAVNKKEKQALENMLIASNLAGKAISIAQTTMSHAVSYPITSYFDIPHGHAVSLTLPSFIDFNHQVSDDDLQDERGLSFVMERMQELVQALDVDDSKQAKEKLNNLMRNIGLETHLSKLNIDRQGIKLIVQNGFHPQRAKNNPRKISEEQLSSLLNSLL